MRDLKPAADDGRRTNQFSGNRQNRHKFPEFQERIHLRFKLFESCLREFTKVLACKQAASICRIPERSSAC